MPPAPDVLIFDPTASSGRWLHKQLTQIHIPARWVTTASEVLAAAEEQSPVVCLFALRPPVSQALELLADLIQEPRFAHTAFIGVGSLHDKHAAFEAGADDYLITPPDIIELRKRVRLHLDRAALEARLVAETRITQEMEALSKQNNAQPSASEETLTLLEHVAQLTRERDLYETMLRSAGCPIALISPEGTADYVNPAWEQYFGPAEMLLAILGWPPHTGTPEADRALQQALAQNGAWQGSARLRTVRGDWIEMVIALTPVRGAAGELYAYTLVMMDISARQLPRTRRASLIANAVTELRSPLSNIKTRLYLLQSAQHEKQLEEHLQTLNAEVEHLTQVLEKISELFHLDEGLSPPAHKLVELNQLVQGVAARYSAQTTHRFTFRFVPYDNLPPVHGDVIQLARALGVLLECIMHVSPPEARVTLEVGLSFAAERPFATVQVRNAELPPLTEKAFSTQAQEMLYSGDPNTAELRLNLAIAREIVALHNGMLTVAQGNGPQYALTLWLPLSAPEDDDEGAR